MNKTIVGLQWGDEAKAKVLDTLAFISPPKCVVRFNGGNNAGHTVVANGKKYIFHAVPAGVLNPNVECIIGSGTVVDIEELYKEILALTGQGLSLANLKISSHAHVILPEHKALDASTTKNTIGTTGRGIGPCYSAKIARKGLRVIDLFNQQLTPDLQEAINFIKPFITNTQQSLLKYYKEDRSIFFEGAQGMMLDIDNGTYPYVTSSNAHPGAAATTNGLPCSSIGEVIGISKAYTTRVGLGPFPTELNDSIGDYIRKIGHEYGSTTGRPRRCGWLDLVQLKYAVEMAGVDQIVLTKLDVLADVPEIQVCTAYQEHLDPISQDILWEKAKPCYKTLTGFPKKDWSKIFRWDDLPTKMQDYIRFIEDYLHQKINYISLGPERESLIEL